MDLLFHADILLDDYSVLTGGYLGVSGDRICYIGQEKPSEAYESFRAMPGHLLIPGLYNLHTHSSMVLMRGVGSDLPLDRWLEEKMFPVEAKLVDADISVGTRLAMLEMLASGVVSFSDMYMSPQISAAEIERTGMKVNFSKAIVALDHSIPHDENAHFIESLAFYDSCGGSMANDRIKVDFGIHAEYTSHEAIVRRYGEECKARGAIMHLHLSETQKEHRECKVRHGKTPARWFYDLGIFENPTVAAHCVAIEPGDIELLASCGVTAVHNPSSNLKLGSGFMPLPAMLERGVKLAIGTDGAASNNNLNLFEEMHLASIIHKGYMNDPTVLSPTQLLSMATLAGAAAQGRENCGALKVGYKADIAAIDLDRPHLIPMHDIPAALTYSAQASDVTMTMVDGKILYENGEYLTIDAERVRHDVKQSMGRLFG
ncbi:MAG: amidohydrolase [Oscillospiraceae bacterium]|nr:amidohydrolase [Oscillospiraceae bacterium]